MMDNSFFQPSDQEIAKKLLIETYPYPYLGEQSIKRFLNIWETFVSLFEGDYEKSIHEYVHMLELRNLLERIAKQLSSNGQVKLRQYLESLDSRYKDATKEVEYSIRGNYQRDFWWWYRIPQKYRESQTLQLFLTPKFNDNDKNRIEQRLTQLSKKMPLDQRLDYLLSNWVNFVIKIKNGYTLDAYNYSHSLLGRRILEEIFRELSENGKKELLPILQPLDEMFLRHTVPTSSESSSFLGQYDKQLSWLNRLPSQMSSQLKSQFAKMEVFSNNISP